MIAMREAWQQGLLGRAHWLPNLISGVVVAVVALPLSMAFAIASGVKPEQGLYTAIIAGLVVATFGGTRLQIAGPTGAFIVILAAITAEHGVVGLQIATLMAGAILIVLGVTRLGSVVRYVPDPVIVGFTAGIGVIIWVSQWPAFFGIDAGTGPHFHQKLWHLLRALPQAHPATTGIAVLALAAVLLTPRIAGLRRVPGPLVAMVLATLVQAVGGFDGVATIGSAFGGIPQSLPMPSLPEITPSRMIELTGAAITIALLGAIESLLSAVVADTMAGTRHDSNQELIGQGLANLLTPLFGGFAATGAIARTATNIRNGGTGPLAGIVHSVTLVAIILLLAPLASRIPLAALAAILFSVAWHMSDLHRVVRLLRRAPRADAAILMITLVLTVFVDLVVAVNAGVILAILQFLRRMSESVTVDHASNEALAPALAKCGLERLPDDVLVFTVQGPFFFGAVGKLDRAMVGTRADTRVMIIRLDQVPFLDATALNSMEDAIRDLQLRGVSVALCEANQRVSGKLQRGGITALLDDADPRASLADVLGRVLNAPSGRT
ncbi:MAG: SulP family inorganic anion transporter [Burkholderiaceae bacterium]